MATKTKKAKKSQKERVFRLLDQKSHTAAQLIRKTGLTSSTVFKYLALPGVKSRPAPRTGKRGRPARLFWVG